MQIASLSLARSVWMILSHRRLLQRGIEILRASLSEFFLPQFQSLLKPGIRPIAIMDHPLDSQLPFSGDRVRGYLGYIPFWLKTLLYLYVRFGPPALGEIEQMMRDLRRLYIASGDVYRRCQSTTSSRPAAPANPYFLLLLLFDPHLHCIPSLHVLTVCYNYFATRRAVERLGGSSCVGKAAAAEAGAAEAQTYRFALRIAETTLLVKQHSVYDIGPTLYLLTRLFPGYDAAEVRRFVADLFTGYPYSVPQTNDRLRDSILRHYQQMVNWEKQTGFEKPTDVMVDFLKAQRRRSLAIGRQTV